MHGKKNGFLLGKHSQRNSVPLLNSALLLDKKEAMSKQLSFRLAYPMTIVFPLQGTDVGIKWLFYRTQLY